MGIKNREIITAAGVQTILNIVQPAVDLKCNDLPPDNVAISNFKYSTFQIQERWIQEKWESKWSSNYCKPQWEQTFSFGKENTGISSKAFSYFQNLFEHSKFRLPRKVQLFEEESIFNILARIFNKPGYQTIEELHETATRKDWEIKFTFKPHTSKEQFKCSARPSSLVMGPTKNYHPQWEFTSSCSSCYQTHPSILIMSHMKQIEIKILVDRDFKNPCFHDLTMPQDGRSEVKEMVMFANSAFTKTEDPLDVHKTILVKTGKPEGITAIEGDISYDSYLSTLYYKEDFVDKKVCEKILLLAPEGTRCRLWNHMERCVEVHKILNLCRSANIKIGPDFLSNPNTNKMMVRLGDEYYEFYDVENRLFVYRESDQKCYEIWNREMKNTGWYLSSIFLNHFRTEDSTSATLEDR
eukprot:GHVP01042974.1.p1 GENE.GHVP01042974.1~~GHVP01042974.1.p1  ORF type:complete len:411 (-),score=62.59 GHVP01042974.1:171-1403(-)